MVPNALFTIFGKGVYLYGICIAVGIIVCLLVMFYYLKRAGMDRDRIEFIFYIGIIGIVLGFIISKFYQAIYNWIDTGLFDFMGAGITAMGGFIGGAVTVIVLYFTVGRLYYKGENWKVHLSQFNLLVRVAPLCIVIAHAFGRIGCLMAGCCHGAYLGEQYVFGGIWMKGNGIYGWGYYVPTQLYESLFLFVLFAVLSVLYFKKCNFTMQIYLIAYGIWRIFIEMFRTDARGAVVLGLYPSQWQSIIFILGGVALFVFYIIKKIPMWLDKSGK